MNKLTEDTLEFIVSRVLQNAKENIDEIKKSGSNEFSEGKRLAYYETIDIIKNELIAREVDLSQFGLNVDVDKFA